MTIKTDLIVYNTIKPLPKKTLRKFSAFIGASVSENSGFKTLYFVSL